MRSGTGARRRTSWSLGPFGTSAISISNGTALFPTGAVATQDGLTIVRSRGEVLLMLSATDQLLGGWGEISLGLCIVSENAFAVGITAVPHPSTDIAWDGWLWYWTGALRSITTSAVLLGQDLPAQARIVVDSKAMRKIKATDVLVGVIEVGTEAGTATITAEMNTRILLKLS